MTTPNWIRQCVAHVLTLGRPRLAIKGTLLMVEDCIAMNQPINLFVNLPRNPRHHTMFCQFIYDRLTEKYFDKYEIRLMCGQSSVHLRMPVRIPERKDTHVLDDT